MKVNKFNKEVFLKSFENVSKMIPQGESRNTQIHEYYPKYKNTIINNTLLSGLK